MKSLLLISFLVLNFSSVGKTDDFYNNLEVKSKIQNLSNEVDRLTQENTKLKGEVEDIWHEMRELRKQIKAQ